MIELAVEPVLKDCFIRLVWRVDCVQLVITKLYIEFTSFSISRYGNKMIIFAYSIVLANIMYTPLLLSMEIMSSLYHLLSMNRKNITDTLCKYM